MFDTTDLITFLGTWQKLLEVVQQEVECNPEFAERLQAALGETLLADTRERLRHTSIDPFEILREHGEAGLGSWLVSQEPLILRTIIKTYTLDPGKKTSGWRERERLAEFILERMRQRIQQGRVFLQE